MTKERTIVGIMGTPGVGGRRRMTTKLSSAAEDQALDIIAKEAETRLAARRAARAEAREIRMRELEKQQKEVVSRSASHGSSYAGSRRSSEDSIEVVDGRDVRDGRDNREGRESREREGRETRTQLSDLEEKFRKAMIHNAQMDNEKSTLAYQVDVLKDEMEDIEENHLQLQKENKEKCREYDRLIREKIKLCKETSYLKLQIDQRDKLIQEHGLVLVTEDGELQSDQTEDSMQTLTENGSKPKAALVSHEAAQLLEQAGEGSLDVRLKRFAEEKQDLLDEIRRLKLDLEDERQRNNKIEKLSTQGPQANGPDIKLLEAHREANKLVSDYKFRLQKAEQEIATLQGNVARLDSQVFRHKGAAEASEKLEDELKAEKRKMQRELREAQARIEELETANSHLQKRIDKLKTVRNTLVK